MEFHWYTAFTTHLSRDLYHRSRSSICYLIYVAIRSRVVIVHLQELWLLARVKG